MILATINSGDDDPVFDGQEGCLLPPSEPGSLASSAPSNLRQGDAIGLDPTSPVAIAADREASSEPRAGSGAIQLP